MSITLPILPQEMDMAEFRQHIRRARYDRENEVAAMRRKYANEPASRWASTAKKVENNWPMVLLILGGLLVVALCWGGMR